MGTRCCRAFRSDRNEWSEGLLKGHISSDGSTANYYEVDGESLGEKKLWLQDDYVKFIRLSHYLLEQSSVGIHGMITNHSFVDSPTCRGMRFQMLRFFSSLYFIDLHGSTKKGETPPDGLVDENVFDILPGVAISICLAKNKERDIGEVCSDDVWGTRSFKLRQGHQHELLSDQWNRLAPASPYYLFSPA